MLTGRKTAGGLQMVNRHPGKGWAGWRIQVRQVEVGEKVGSYMAGGGGGGDAQGNSESIAFGGLVVG